MMKKLDKEAFDKLLKENKEAALEKLRDSKGNYLEEVQIGEQKYKIFAEVPDVLFTNETSEDLLPKDYAAFIVCNINQQTQITRADFQYWYFTGKTNFKDATFTGKTLFLFATFTGDVIFQGTKFPDVANFSGARFSREVRFFNAKFAVKANFMGARFGVNALFWRAEFADASFINAIFADKTDFWKAVFTGEAKFNNVEFKSWVRFEDAIFSETRSLSFKNTVFKERCDLRVEKFGTFVDFRGAEFRGALFLEGTKLCENEKKLSFPSKSIVKEEGKVNNEESKKNILAVKQIFNKIPSYEDEDHFYRWFKRYERESKTGWHPVNWLIEKVTGYFTMPIRVFGTMLFVWFTSVLVYWGANNYFPDTIGYLRVFNANGQAVKLMNCWDTLYFSLITFTTIGYGDIQPTGWLKLVAGLEGFVGVLLISTFLVTLTRKWLR